MKAFWWFKENLVAGMARPGFNAVNWFELPFEETLVFGWLGQRTCGVEPLQSLRQHILEYGSKIRGFHKVDDISFSRIREDFEKTSRIVEVLGRVAERTGCVEKFEIRGDQISFELSRARLASEIEFLKQNGVGWLVTLTEHPNQHEELSRHFNLCHLGIDDLTAPRFDQALQLAQVLREAKSTSARVAVHCMAGIGRTSTMLMAAYLILGESFDSLLAQLEARNPSFKFTEAQAEFVRSVADRVQQEEVLL